MSQQVTLPEVVALAGQLPPAERRQLAETILQDLANEAEAVPPARRRSWREIRGIVPYPLCGEDAQAWVTRSRRTSGEHRERHQRSQD